MLPEYELREGVHAVIDAIDVPPAPIGAILERGVAVRNPRPFARGLAIGIAACLALAIIVAPSISWSYAQSIASRVAAILHWTPPPSAPRALLSTMHVHDVSFARARAMVAFHLVAPVGLPRDARLSSILVIPTAHYSAKTKTWNRSANAVVFNYARRSGRTLHLMASAYSPMHAASKYMFVQVGAKPDGMPILRRFEQFAWRNGDQAITTMDDGISAGEIARIRDAMRGTALALRWPRTHRDGATMFLMNRELMGGRARRRKALP